MSASSPQMAAGLQRLLAEHPHTMLACAVELNRITSRIEVSCALRGATVTACAGLAHQALLVAQMAAVREACTCPQCARVSAAIDAAVLAVESAMASHH